MGETAVAALKIAHASAIRMLRGEMAARPVLSNWQAVLDYLHAEMAYHTIERVRVLHLNVRNMLIRDELVAEGSIDQAPVYAREVIRRAIELGSAALILVHNHPSGDVTPSRADIDLTRIVVQAAKHLDIAVHDHVIIGTQGHTSLRAKGLM
jgi:DNA repair protein RadC